jgi:SAM-dependent methyltransferase
MGESTGIKLDIGCGRRKQSGFLGVDKIKLEGVDVICDLEREKLPFEDNSVTEIYSRYFFEHVSNLVSLMEEVWRVSAPGAKLCVAVPYFNSVGAFKDPTHVRFFTFETFDYFTDSGKVPSYYSKAKFKIVKKKIIFYPYGSNIYGKIRYIHLLPIQFVANLLPYIYEHSFLKLFSARDLYVELEAVKDK